MIYIDEVKCDGCGKCVEACPQQAIIIVRSRAVVNEQACTGCGSCVLACAADAIRELALASRKISEGGGRMFYRYGRGCGFRGSSPPWPYVGWGRGGLLRCWYPGLQEAVAPYAAPAPYWVAPTWEEELGFLRSQAEAMRRQLEDIERRIQELEKKS